MSETRIETERAGRFLGRAGLRYWPQFDETEIGWVLCWDAWGRGYASEAAGAILDWGFEVVPAPYITAMIDTDNERSIRVARRLWALAAPPRRPRRSTGGRLRRPARTGPAAELQQGARNGIPGSAWRSRRSARASSTCAQSWRA
jgi:hypothetical protein